MYQELPNEHFNEIELKMSQVQLQTDFPGSHHICKCRILKMWDICVYLNVGGRYGVRDVCLDGESLRTTIASYKRAMLSDLSCGTVIVIV